MLVGLPAQVLYAEESIEEPKPDTYNKLKIFSEVLSLIESNYVESVESDTIINGAIRGMVKALDPHTSYLPPASYKEMQVETTGKFGGLGIEISIRDGVLTVVSPIDDTPAFKVGIKAGDKIIRIEEESTLDMTLQDAVGLLRGETGSPVTITIFRKSFKAPKEFTIVAESGIKTHDQIKQYNDSGIFNFLIGESILKSTNISNKIKELKGE